MSSFPTDVLSDSTDFHGVIRNVTINPLNAEDEQGTLIHPMPDDLGYATCFDLTDTPAKKWPAYLRYLFHPQIAVKELIANRSFGMNARGYGP